MCHSQPAEPVRFWHPPVSGHVCPRSFSFNPSLSGCCRILNWRDACSLHEGGTGVSRKTWREDLLRAKDVRWFTWLKTGSSGGLYRIPWKAGNFLSSLEHNFASEGGLFPMATCLVNGMKLWHVILVCRFVYLCCLFMVPPLIMRPTSN